jgi:hypothetical protein
MLEVYWPEHQNVPGRYKETDVCNVINHFPWKWDLSTVFLFAVAL